MENTDVASARLPIIQYWHSPQIPNDVAAMIATFRAHNPDLPHMLFDHATAEQFIAAHFGAREVAAFRSCAVPAMQADYLRYCAVLQLGGIYADADYRCLRPLGTLLNMANQGLLFRRQPPGNLINGFFLFESPGHPLLKLTLNIATSNIEHRAATEINMVTGPWIFAALAAIHRMGSLEAAHSLVQKKEVERLASSIREAIDSYEQVVEAFRGVRIASLGVAMNWIGEPAEPLQYQQGDAHWVNWNGSERAIFR